MRATVKHVCHGVGAICAGLGIIRVFFPAIDALTVGLILGGCALGVAPKFARKLRLIREFSVGGVAVKFGEPQAAKPETRTAQAPAPVPMPAPAAVEARELVEAAGIADDVTQALLLGERLEVVVRNLQGRAKDEAIFDLTLQLKHVIAAVQHGWTRRCLTSPQLRHRLVGYAAACRFPDARLLPDLAATLADVENHPDGQEWCIAAIGYCAEPAPERIDEATLMLLEMCLTFVPLTDDAYRQLLAVVQRARHGGLRIEWSDRDGKPDLDR